MIPYKCPVCDGIGKRIYYPDCTINTQTVTCHACGGTGIVWEKVEQEEQG